MHYNFYKAKGNKMQTIQVGKLKHDLASVLEMVKGGQEFIVEFGRKHQPIAAIVPYSHIKYIIYNYFGIIFV